VTAPDHTLLLVERRPAFSYRLPVDAVTVLRADMTIGGLNGRLHIVGMVEDDDGVEKADVILEDGACPVRPHQPAQLAALIEIPADTPPGVYMGKIRFFAHALLYDERLAAEAEISVAVEDVTLPSGHARTFYLNLWQHVFNIARQHEVRAYTDDHIRALRPYAQALGALGNKAVTVLLSDAPWCGQGCYREQLHPSDLYEYNFVRVRRTAAGEFLYDFSFAQAYINLMMDFGAEEIMFTGLYGVWMDGAQGFERIVGDWPDAIRISYIDEADGALRWIRTRGQLEQYVRAVCRWIREAGYADTCYWMGDEVNLDWVADDWDAAMRELHEWMPGMRMDWDLPPEALISERYAGERVDVYTPQIEQYALADPGLRQAARARIEPGGKCLWSVCCTPPVMNSFLRTDLNEVRLHGLMTEHLKMDGFIRWNFTAWPKAPRASLSFLGWKAGDTCFVYPGRGGQCLLSLRYLALKRGIEDYELAQMVKRRPGGGEAVARALSRVLRESELAKWDFFDVHGREAYMSLDSADYDAARGILLDALTGRENRDL
jgi:hypothetical protein